MGQNDSKVDKEMEIPLTEEQMSSLPLDIREELQKYSTDQALKECELKAKYERLRVDSEQKYFELEQLQKSEHEKWESEAKTASELQLLVTDLEKRYNDTSEKYRDLQTKFFEKDKYWNGQEQSLLQKNSNLEIEKSDLIHLLTDRNTSLENLTVEYRQISDKFGEEIKTRLTAQSDADEAKSEMVILQHREDRLNQELKHLRQQNEILNQQLQDRFNEIMSVRKEKSLRLIELQGLLDDSLAKVTHLEQSLEASKVTQAEQEQKMEAYVEKLKEARDCHIEMEEQYRNELVAQDKLLNLYKVASSEAGDKVKEMAKAVEELQNLLKQASQAYSELKAEKEQVIRNSQEQITSRDEKVQHLERELINANELLEVMKKKAPTYISEEDAQVLSPAAAAASRLLKSGMTLTQIYSEYAETLNQLQNEKAENVRITSYLDTILQEVEEKAPLIRKQKADYEEALEAIDRLTHQLEASLVECEKCRTSSDDNQRRCGDLRRQNERYIVQIKDLSQQVRMLLKELEEARGTVVQMSPSAGDTSSSEVTSSSLLISEKLVSFRSIEELQEQNQKLLQVVRELSEAAESDERKQTREDRGDRRLAELEEQLEKAQEEINEMRENRERQASLVESLVQQRDMFRLMAANPPHLQTSPLIRSPISSTPAPNSVPMLAMASPLTTTFGEQEQKALQETRTALKELQEEFSIYRREKGDHEKILNEQLGKTTKDASDFRLQNAKLASQLSFSNERYKILQSNVESHKKEIEALRDKNQKLTESVIRHQQTIALLREETQTMQDKLSAAEIRNQNLLTEKEMLKSLETRLSSEIDSVRKDSQSRDILLNTLQAIQNNLERKEFETKVQLGKRIENLEKDNVVLRKKAEGTDDQQRAFIITLERQLNEARTETDVERSKSGRLTEQMTNADSLIINLREEISALESKLSISESKLFEMSQHLNELQQQTDPSQKLKEEIKDLRKHLNEAENEIQNLQDKLDQSRRNVEQYRSIAETMEASLKEQNEASQQLRDSLETQLSATSQVKELLESELKDMEVERLRLLEVNAALTVENDRIVSEQAQMLSNGNESDAIVMERITELENELSHAVDSRDVALANELTARHDCDIQATEAREAQNKYERELVLHAAAVEALTHVKQELEGIHAKMAAGESEAKESKNALTSAQESWMEQEAFLQKEMSDLRERLSGLHSQNTILHQELEKMSEQMVQMQSIKEQEESQQKQLVEVVEKDPNPKSSEQLLEVIRYLRREKEVAEAKHGLIEAEVNRLRQQMILLKKQLESAEQSLMQEVEKSSIKMESAAKHAELMKKIETLNLLQDSNQLLRMEKERMSHQLKELETKNTKFELELGPLKEAKNDLTAQWEASQREIEILMGEVDRWKNRTSHLIEQCNKFDPEEHKRALEDRDQLKRQLETISEENQSLRNQVSRLIEQVSTAQSEIAKIKEHSENLGQQLVESKSSIAAKDADDEEKNKTILQLRKIGRKYRMQAEETQKELEELKNKGIQAATAELDEQLRKMQQELATAQKKLKETEQEAAEMNARLLAEENEKKEAAKRMKTAEEKEQELNDQLATIKGELSRLSEERSNMEDSHLKSVEEKDKMVDEYNRLMEENKTLKEEREKLEKQRVGFEEEKNKMGDQMKELEKRNTMMRNLVMNAKQRLEDRRTEIEKLTGEYEDVKKQLEAEKEEKTRLKAESEEQQRVTQQTPAEEMELRLSTIKSQFEGKIARLERELTEQTSTKMQESETADRLRRENQELQQRVSVLQSHIEAFQRQFGQSPTKPTVTAPPVERSGPGVSMDAVAGQRRTYVKPMTSVAQPTPLRHSAPVQPVRSTAGIPAETRAMASIRPMAVASTQPMATPMATVMPTTMSVQENESLQAPNVLSQSAVLMQQGRPTQQVQPVSSHVEESTVSSSEEPIQEGIQPIATWWLEHAMPSTSSEHTMLPSGGGSSSSGMSNKRPREETRQQEEGAETDGEGPAKRSKIQTGEAADTTETNAVAEIDREAASYIAQTLDNQQPAAEMRRELEPVSTSLAMEELSRNSDMVREDKRPSVDQMEEGLVMNLPSDDLPDYQETEASATEYDIRPSTSRQHGSDVDEQSNQESINQSEPRDDNEDAGAGEGGQTQDDVICVEDDEGAESGTVCGGRRSGGVEYQADNSEEEDEEYNQGYHEEVEDIEEDDFEVEEKEEGVAEDIYEGMDAEVQVEEESTNDVIIVDDEAAAAGDNEQPEKSSDVIHLDDNVVPVSAMVSTSQSHQLVHRHVGLSTVRLANMPSADGGGAVRVIQQSAAARSTGSQQMDRIATQSRAQLMPFIFGSDIGGGFEIGDDGIVPSTPTLSVSIRTDGFAEAVSSPQVTEEFSFGLSSDSVPHFELAQQRGIGVDDTRMDLSQFDDHTSRGQLTTPPCSQSSPMFIPVGHLSPEHFQEQSQEALVATILSKGDRTNMETSKPPEALPSCSSQSVSVPVSGGIRSQSPVLAEEEEEEEEDTLGQDDQSRSVQYQQQLESAEKALGGPEDKSSTSEAGGSGTSDRLDTSQAQTKPKIKKIVWQEPSGLESQGTTSGLLSSSGQQQVSSQQQQQQSPSLIGLQQGTLGPRRGYARGCFRGRGSAPQQQQSVRPLLSVPLMSPQSHSPQVARRARGSRGGGGSNVWSSRQQHFP